ncbi:TPA: HIT family protein [Legionella feeleii]|uniref:Diadenosine tetraphosphate (Ap4A) hydrolase-like HIT family hydrolase n=1 Tax=Legionella feeleii TaxID=453 RepID=A0A0W0TK85_9GAMM|nr:HIT family protein [Legionella feeleii]KTC95970.1 diadenosine tetraphosphate (Ap4A) hydrolase-like HIT family hydrolase [Legionella feeleii]SPX60270.1 diadenosine tetraphosphate (Ap4A) hydrolase-like HIT family hydrolase [Legionella feeleii]STX37619.1 diadenosine tetraphosphate (Ap4A) hydrolase-like HIT family hydrolase [Legionella feeleii]
MGFVTDERIQASSIWLDDLSLSRVYLKNEADFPWFILVPREENIQEIYQLSPTKRQLLIEEIAQISNLVNTHFKPDKLNVGALGNIVSQLHIHVVARFNGDKAWPHGIWQSGMTATPYSNEVLQELIPSLRAKIASGC